MQNKIARVARFVLPPLLLLASMSVHAQGIERERGHAEINDKTVFAAWNFAAGREIPRNFSLYPEILPNLQGWDFRINLPHVRFQQMRVGRGSVPTMVGVVEGGPSDATLHAYGHISNSIWIFQVAGDDSAVHFKVLPSRRDLSANTVENVSSLATGWSPIAGPALIPERIGATVLGTGRGTATIYLAARAGGGILHFNRRLVTAQSDTSWPNAWTSLETAAAAPPVLAPIGNGRLAMAWLDPKGNRVRVQIYTPSMDAWGPRLRAATAGVGRPQLVWDGQNLNLFYVDRKSKLLKHCLVREDALDEPRTVLQFVAIKDDHFDVMRFNSRLHVVARQDAGEGNPTRLFYTSSTTVSGSPSRWAIPSEVGFTVRGKPEIAYLNDNVFVMGVATASGRVRYARKDPNARGNDLTGAAFADSWLASGATVDTLGSFTEIDALSFNSDIYLTGFRIPSDDVLPHASHIVNFSRAAMKKIIRQQRGIRLHWGSPGGGDPVLPKGIFAKFTPGLGRHPFMPIDGDVPLVGDFNGDDRDDLVKFAQKAVPGDGIAPVYVSVGRDQLTDFSLPDRWHRFFSLKGEIPLVGDFNGDGRDDIVTFVQKRQNFSNGTLLGRAPVWVALSDGTRFLGSRVWQREFSLLGEIPMVGDFNGDGADDVASFVRKPQGGVGTAPVWVALSDRTKFLPATVWHTSFSSTREIPLVGDFDGDGDDDIVTFAQDQMSPVRVALSNGSNAFGANTVWHEDFADEGQLPRVADLNLDGRDDIVAFVHGELQGERATNVYVAFSNGQRFGRATTWYSDFAGDRKLPAMGYFMGNTLRDITDNPADGDKRIPGMAAFGHHGEVHVANGLLKNPMPSGAPWEHYKWFTEKGLGTAMFPDWIWDGPNDCLAEDHLFALTGASGSGAGSLTKLSVRFGGREWFVMEEVGHSLFSNCFRGDKDPFDMVSSIFGTQPLNGVPGINSNARPGCPGEDDFYDCRSPPEHYFLGLMMAYKLTPEDFRARIAIATGARRVRLENQYLWMRRNWYEGTEFKTGPELDANFAEVGLQRLPED